MREDPFLKYAVLTLCLGLFTLALIALATVL